jgi:hypothetical protein
MYEVSLSLGVDSPDRKFDSESLRANGLQSMKGITEDSNDRATFALVVMFRKNVVVWAGAGACELSRAKSAEPLAVRGRYKNRLIAR